MLFKWLTQYIPCQSLVQVNKCKKKQYVSVKYYAPSGKKVQKATFRVKVKRSLTLVLLERASLVK